MPIKLGNKADGDDFFDRNTERDNLWRYLAGNHIVLSGPRRLGKTSLLQRVAEEAKSKGLLARLIDVEGIESAHGFIGELARAFPDETVKGYLKTTGKRLSSLVTYLPKVNVTLPDGSAVDVELQAIPEAPWRDAAIQLQKRLSSAPVLILIDEFSVFLEKTLARDAHEAEMLLGWLRAWRLQSGLSCRFVFSGSIGINSLLNKHRLSTRFNDCHDIRLGPFKLHAALAMMTEQARREDWQMAEGCPEHLCERIGWLSPFYLNLLLATTMEAARDRLLETNGVERILRQSDVDDAYDRLLTVRSRFIHWHQRLVRDLGEPELSFALAVLGAIARSKKGLTRKELLARLQGRESDPDKRTSLQDDTLLTLEEDGYLDTASERIQFLSFLLKDYWRRNHAS